MVSRRHSGDKQCSNLTLQHILPAAPRLLQLISSQDLKAVFFTSRGLRQCVQDCCTKCICLTATMTGLQSLVAQKWPPLLAQKLAICHNQDVEELDRNLHALVGAQWPKLAVLDLSNLYLGAYDIEILASAHLPALTAVILAGNGLLGDAIKELVRASWPCLEMLNVSCQARHYLQSPSTAADYLVKGEWPLLKTLDVSRSNVCIGHLLSGKWPALENLILLNSKHDGDTPAFVKETSGLSWPSLKRLSLSDGALDDSGIAELTLAEWPCLEFVCLDDVSAEQGAEIFASCEWPALSHLELKRNHSVGEVALMCTRLSQVHLPVLETLVIEECYLDAAAVAELVKGAWKLLRHVSLVYLPIDAADVAQLVQANWHNLHVLDLSCCILNFEAVSELSRGQWPLLHTLSGYEYPRYLWPTNSVKRLLDGSWPALSKLVLSPSDCEAAAFLLSGSTELLITFCDSDYFFPLSKVRKTVTGCGPTQWPCLKFSTFVFQHVHLPENLVGT